MDGPVKPGHDERGKYPKKGAMADVMRMRADHHVEI